MATPTLSHRFTVDDDGARVSAFPGVPDPIDEPAPRRDPPRRPRRGRAGALRAPLLVTLVAAAAIAATWAASTPALAGAASGVAWLQAQNDLRAREMLTTVLAAAAALSFVVAWARATSPRRPVRLASGRGRIAVEAVAGELRATLLERPDVVAARVEVENRHRRGLWVSGRLDVTPSARLEETLRAATLATEELVNGRLGVALATAPRFDLRYDELDLRAGRAHDIRSHGPRRRDAGDGRAAR
jgi:hypothetical protein